ncbi:MAG: hypothetical protein JXA21_08550 [Anaerolineae bacterium]|nr:hypothetical protein [Anaerolineae bacterium]
MCDNRLCFPKHEGLPHHGGLPPTVDGYIEPELDLTTSELETGWVRSTRLTYVGEAGLDLMTFQGLMHNEDDYIYLSFRTRCDNAFDLNDAIVLVFDPDFDHGAAPEDRVKTGDERRIDIFPLTSIGAGEVGDTADPHDDPDPSKNLRTNRPPHKVDYYKWNTGTSSWTMILAPAGVEIKVRSWWDNASSDDKNWCVEIKLPTTAAEDSDWVDLGTSLGFYFDVIRVCGTEECSDDELGDFFTSQFTWPGANYGTGHGLIRDPDTGPLPSLADHPIPVAYLGEAILGTTADCRGVRFADGCNGIGVMTEAVGQLIPLADLADGTIPLGNEISGVDLNKFVARLVNDATADATDVHATFRIANWGVGPGTSGTWDPVTVCTDPPHDPNNANPTQTPDAIPGGPAGTGGPITALTMDWKLNNLEKAQYDDGKFDDHQCILVKLHSDHSVDFVESSMRRNLNFVDLSTYQKNAEISGKGYPDPPDGDGQHDFVLVVNQRRLVAHQTEAQNKVSTQATSFYTKRAPGLQKHRALTGFSALQDILLEWWGKLSKTLFKQPVHTWIWVLNAYRRTEYTLTLGEKPYRVYQPTGAFGYNARHVGRIKEWKYEVTGVEKQPGVENRFHLRVPHDEVASIGTRMEVVEAKDLRWLSVLVLVLIIAIIIAIRLLLG